MIVLGAVRDEVANYVQQLFSVYGLLIVVYVITGMIFSFGVKPPYSRALNVVLGFLRDVSEPYLRIFRRVIPMAGPIDLSPIVALLVLSIVGRIVVSLIQG